MRISFGARVFAALAALVVLATAAALVSLEQLTSREIEERFAARFLRAHSAFREMESLRLDFVALGIESLAESHPQLRTVLSTASLADQFGPAAGAGPAEHDANLRLRSLLPSLTFARRSDVLAVLSASGRLLYSQADPERVGDDVSRLDVFQTTLEQGRADAVWVAPRSDPGPRLLPAAEGPALYRVLTRPVVFDGDLHGVVLAGHRVDRELLVRTRAVSGLEVALVARGLLVATTLDGPAAAALADRLGELPGGASGEAPWRLELEGAHYLAGRAALSSRTPPQEAGFVLLGPLDADLAFLGRLRGSVLAVGAVVLLGALLPALGLARGITRPVSAMARAARGIGAGALDTRVQVARSDEVGELGRAFNEMAAGLQERERIRRTLERHVSPEVAQELLRHPERAQPAGVRRELTVAFFDLAGFSAWAERSEPEALVAGLSEYFEVVSESVLSGDGTVNEFVGDGVVVFWGAPLPQSDHAIRAGRSVLRARRDLAALVERWGRPDIDFRIGVHTGELVVGEVGGAERRAYRAVGDAMNVASRIEGAGRSYGTRLLVSDTVMARSDGAFVAREIDRVRVVGRREPLDLFELVAEAGQASAEQRAFVEVWSQALSRYRAGAFAEAERLFRDCLARVAEDGPSAVFAERCRAYRQRPPGPDWDGVHELRSK